MLRINIWFWCINQAMCRFTNLYSTPNGQVGVCYLKKIKNSLKFCVMFLYIFYVFHSGLSLTMCQIVRNRLGKDTCTPSFSLEPQFARLCWMPVVRNDFCSLEWDLRQFLPVQFIERLWSFQMRLRKVRTWNLGNETVFFLSSV